MPFHRVHIEVTNVCGLACSFCPPKTLPPKSMPLPLFERTLMQLVGRTKQLAFHVMGDPLTLPNLSAYLDLALHHGFRVELTTSGYYLKRTPFATLFHPAVRQINVSLNSFNKNSLNMTFDAYMEGVAALCTEKLANHPDVFINLRLWNLDEAQSEAAFNAVLFARLLELFGTAPSAEMLESGHRGGFRLAPKVLLHFDRYFEWPSLDGTHDSDGTCHGLSGHIGILADGTVVPCCLDGDGVIALGNLNDSALDTVLSSQRAVAMREGFASGKAVEALCRKCSYKTRFGTEP